MKIIYTKGWFRSQKRPLEIYSEDYAKSLFVSRGIFTTLIEDKGRPYCFINFNNKFVYVGFLDEFKREYLGYEFWEEKPGKIFLKEVQFWEFEGDTDEKLNSTRYRFTPEGELGIEKRNNKTREAVREYAQNKVDTSVLWEDYPEFGHYDAIIKIEREISTALSENV